MSRSGNGASWESSVWCEAETEPGVRFRIVRPSLLRRADLTRRVRTLVERATCHAASEKPEERLSAALLQLEADRVHIEWGLLELEGLAIDGEPAECESLIEKGPEALCREIAERIRVECGLTEDERKN